MRRTTLSSAVTAGALLSAAMIAQAGIVNGDFETGALLPWTTYTTTLGTIGTPQVVSFNTTGTGASLAVQLRVGNVFSGDGGGGISQNFTSEAGLFSVSADIASYTTSRQNFEGGLFSLLLDGTVLDWFDFGQIDADTTERASLSYSGSIAAGSHTLRIQAQRPASTGDLTPLQYIDNVVLTLPTRNAVPEPSALALVCVALLGLRLSRRRVN
jgi:hypothetical protein